MGEGHRERGRHRIRSRLQAPSCQHRALHGARTHGPWDHDLSRSQRLADWATQAPPMVKKKKYPKINKMIRWIWYCCLRNTYTWSITNYFVRWLDLPPRLFPPLVLPSQSMTAVIYQGAQPRKPGTITSPSSVLLVFSTSIASRISFLPPVLYKYSWSDTFPKWTYSFSFPM